MLKAQKSLSSKKKGSKNRQKAKIKLAKTHKKIMNKRNDFLHKSSKNFKNTKILNFLDIISLKKNDESYEIKRLSKTYFIRC